jgi:NAD+ kinase
MKIALFTESIHKEFLPLYKDIFTQMDKCEFEIILSSAFENKLLGNNFTHHYPEYFDSNETLVKSEPDFLISIGGDGTFLNALTLVKDSDIPMLGINAGRLGFLSNNSAENVSEVLNLLKSGNFILESRTVLELKSAENVFGSECYALNDFTIHKRDTTSLTAIATNLNGEFFNIYWCDGIIVSTPTGSTAYSLSCGGPIVFPESNNFIISPVAPHNMNVRPIIVPDNYIISFELKGREKKVMVSLDSRYRIIDHSVSLSVNKAPFTIKNLRFAHQSFSNVLREKLMWGVDKRNKQ